MGRYVYGDAGSFPCCQRCGRPNPRPRSPYCDKLCAKRAGRERRRIENTRHQCIVCAEPMTPSRSSRVFCSAACRAKAWRARPGNEEHRPSRQRRRTNAAGVNPLIDKAVSGNPCCQRCGRPNLFAPSSIARGICASCIEPVIA